MQVIFETLFDAAYLAVALLFGVLMIIKAKDKKNVLILGIMTLILVFGDSFHLIPRIIALHTTGTDDYLISIGAGKLITSVTVTFFYLLLYYIWRKRYNIQGKLWLDIIILVLTISRIVLCIFPQNGWYIANPGISWKIYRNIPFVIMGLIMIVLTYRSAHINNDKTFRFLWLAITLSFAFYIPVVLLAGAYPWVGVFMLPKTACYIWIIVMFYKTITEDFKIDETE
ncbi:MAG: hypothetical protein WCS56_01045 [Bacilli bacterium]